MAYFPYDLLPHVATETEAAMSARFLRRVFDAAPCRLYSKVTAASLDKGRERVFVVGVGMTKFQKVTYIDCFS